MVTRIPIAPEVIKWARERNNLSVSEAAELLKCDHQTLQKIENSELMPSAGLFRRMSDVYLLPEATLLRDTPPADRALPKDFRSFDGNAVSLSYETIATIRRVEARQDALAALAEVDEAVIAPNLPIHSLKESPDKLGATFRKQIGFEVVDQLSFTPSKAFTQWRQLVENMGISVYVEPMGEDDTRGVSLYFNDFPAIVIDKNERLYGARLFTLFHELAHLLVRQAGISNLNGKNSVEAFCNKFSSAFLMPVEAVQSVFDLEKLQDGEPTIQQLEFAAAKLCVTISQIALRLEQLEYVGDGYFKRIASQLKPPAPKKKSEPPKIPFKYRYLTAAGHNFPGTVLDSLGRGEIDTVDASRMLELAPTHFKPVKTELDARRAELVNAQE